MAIPVSIDRARKELLLHSEETPADRVVAAQWKSIVSKLTDEEVLLVHGSIFGYEFELCEICGGVVEDGQCSSLRDK